MNKKLFPSCYVKAAFLLFALIFSGNFSAIHAQIISTIAGGGFGGDGIPATAAALNSPIGVAVDGANNLYISDQGSRRIRKVATSGIINPVAGSGMGGYSGDGGPALLAEMFPEGIAADVAGNFFIAESPNFHINKVNTLGIISNVVGKGTSGFLGEGTPATNAEIWDARSVAVDAAGNIYFADAANNRIRMVNTSGIIHTIGGTGARGFYGDGIPATDAQLNYPNHISVDNKGNIYFDDSRNKLVRKIDASGIITTFAGNGTDNYYGDGGLAIMAALDSAGGIVADAYGNVYIADSRNNRVRMVDASGYISTVAGTGPLGFGLGAWTGDGGPATAAQLNFPVALAMGCGGQLYIADYFNNVIRIISHGMTPVFTKGHFQTLTVCENSSATSINSMLTVNDTDLNQTETWSTIQPPVYGSVYTAYSAPTTGSILTPSGLMYVPVVGFSGIDSFKVQVIDCSNKSDSTTVYVTVNPLPVVGTITGVDSICPGFAVVLSDTTVGGVWTSSNTTITTISGIGSVMGIAPGIDTLTYAATNSCGTTTVLHPFKIRSYVSCAGALSTPANMLNEALKVYPNPSTGSFTIELPGNNGGTTISISDIYGKIVETRNTASPVITFDLSALPKGTYIIKAKNQDHTFREKVNIW